MKGDTGRFCCFSVKLSPDNTEVLAGANDQCIYIFDLQRRQRVLSVIAHDDEVNSVCYLSNDGQTDIVVSASDDGLIKLWDRRILKTANSSSESGSVQHPVSVLIGHVEGITHVQPKGDGRYLISNGKDQCIKLWDIRAATSWDQMSDKICPQRTTRGQFDYRWQMYPRSRFNTFLQNYGDRGKSDQSIMTYRSHRVLETLIRCYWSPAHTTGQRYIYTGSHDGSVYIYDVLTGAVMAHLAGRHEAVVRDCSWHPNRSCPLLISSAWDATAIRWEGVRL